MKLARFLLPALIVCTCAVADDGPASPLGRQIADFTLQDYLGAKHSLHDWDDKQAVVVAFLGAECPLAKLYSPRLAELAERFPNVQFVGINSNQQDTLQEIAHYARVHGVEFPLLKDAGNHVADLFGAERTPQAFVLDDRHVVRYCGRIDDQYGVGYSRADVHREDLAAALRDLLSGQPVSLPFTQAVGCRISRVRRTEPTGEITYAHQISRLLQDHCVSCHRQGQIAPFTLTTYDDVAAWAETILEVMDDGRMPPWHANPEYGHFSNDARMTDEDKQLFHTWVANGVPAGDPADLPEPVEFSEDWQIGEPDVVYRMPEPFTVPAKGTVPYQYFYLDPGFKEDVWIAGAEVRPGNRSVVHHVFLFFVPPGQDEQRAEDPLYNAIAGYAPGAPAGVVREGYARRVPAGSKLGFQVHYTPNGSEQVDQSVVGLIFADEESVEEEVHLDAAINLDFHIPAGARDQRVDAGYVFTQDTYVHALTPHMHYRGRSFRFTAQYPDGTEEILLDVPHYDFNWQNTYFLDEPKLMPEGTVMFCTGHFDNSAGNLVNPDPTVEVTWGDQTWDEMMLGLFLTSLPESAPGEFPKIEHLDGDQFAVSLRYHPSSSDGAVSSVYVAGTFNDWNPMGRKMDGPDKDGWFTVTLELARGYYEYKFVLDGERWTHDPENHNRTGPFSNCVLRVR